MPLPKLKENATEEEKNEWIVKANEEYDKLETSVNTLNETINQNNDTIKDLQELNQKLFVRVTGKKNEDLKDPEEIKPDCIDKETYDQLTDNMKKELNEILEGDEE